MTTQTIKITNPQKIFYQKYIHSLNDDNGKVIWVYLSSFNTPTIADQEYVKSVAKFNKYLIINTSNLTG